MKRILTTIIFTILMTTAVFGSTSLEEIITKGVSDCQQTIDVSMCSASAEDVMETFKEMYNSSPALSGLDGTINCSFSNGMAVSITVGYVKESVSSLDAKKVADKAIDSIAANAKSKANAIEKAKYVHDYLIENSEYDYSYTSNSMYGLLVNKKGTCKSYALVYKAVMDKLGIECDVVHSQDLTHCWNQIKCDGKWYNVDVTWDENYTITETPDNTFFMKSDSSFEQTMHHSWLSSNQCSQDL